MSVNILKKFLFQNIYQKVHYKQCACLSSVVRVVYKSKERVEAENWHENQKASRRKVIEKFENLLGLRKFKAIDLAMKYKKLWEVPGYQIDECFQACSNHKLGTEIIIKNPELLMQTNLNEKFILLRNLKYDILVTAPLLLVPIYDLERFIGTEENICDLNLRIQVFKRCFKKITDEEIFKAFASRSFLRTMNLQHFEDLTKLLLKSGITEEEIMKDWWVLTYSMTTVQQRIELAKECKIDKIKTWMVRGKASIFENYVKRRSDNKSILGDNTLVEYLSENLNCSVDEAKSLLFRMPTLKTRSMIKIKAIIEYLYSEGFTPMHICRVPKILLHSVDTTRKRIREMEKLGIQLDSLHILTKSQKQYMQFYEGLVKSHKNKLKTVS